MNKTKAFPDMAVLVGASKLKELLAAGVNINERDTKGRTALFRTCRAGQLEKVLLLIASGSNPNAVDNKGEAPLQSAARYGHLGGVEALLKAGADVNYCPPPSLTEYSETALCSAVRKCPEAARLLLASGADPNVASDAKIYPLLTAIGWRRAELVPLLLQHNASVAVCDQEGRSALHLAVLQGDADLVRELINAGANKDARDARGETPIFCGVESPNNAMPAILELLKAEPDLTIPSTYWNQTPLECAIARHSNEIADALRKASSPPPREPEIDEDGDVELTIEVDEKDLESIDEGELDWRFLIEPTIDEETLRPTEEEREWSRQTDREIPSLFRFAGYRFSKPHWELLRHAKEPSPLARMAYFARGYRNAPVGWELADGVKVLGETYQSAIERYLSLGLLVGVEDPRAIQAAFTQAKLCAIAKGNGINSTGTKAELAERLFSGLGIAAFTEGLCALGGYFQTTPAGMQEAGGFGARRQKLNLDQRKEAVEALMQHDYLRALKAVRVLALMKNDRIGDKPKTDATSITLARAIREFPMPQKLRYEAGSKDRYMSITAADALLDALGDEWDSWDSSLKPPETMDGEPVRLPVFCAALQGRIM